MVSSNTHRNVGFNKPGRVRSLNAEMSPLWQWPLIIFPGKNTPIISIFGQACLNIQNVCSNDSHVGDLFVP